MAKAKKAAAGASAAPVARGRKRSFERRAADATASGIEARDKFVAKLRAVDPSLVDDFRECLHAMLAPIETLNAELSAETRQVREMGLPVKHRTKSKERI